MHTPLTHDQLAKLEYTWEILDKLRNSEFNESCDFTIGDACNIISDFLDWHQEQERLANRKQATVIHFNKFEAFRNL